MSEKVLEFLLNLLYDIIADFSICNKRLDVRRRSLKAMVKVKSARVIMGPRGNTIPVSEALSKRHAPGLVVNVLG